MSAHDSRLGNQRVVARWHDDLVQTEGCQGITPGPSCRAHCSERHVTLASVPMVGAMHSEEERSHHCQNQDLMLAEESQT
jgi:hypothetical protein